MAIQRKVSRRIVGGLAGPMLLAIGIFAGSAAYAASERCELTKKFVCSPAGCETVEPTIFNLLDFATRQFSRCDDAGCDHYPMTSSVSGIYINIDVPGRGTFAKLSIDRSEYLEVATLATIVFVSFGSCVK